MKKYLLILTTKSFCPYCNKHLRLLQREDCKGVMFYVCWTCHTIFQVGKGEIKEEVKESN